MGMNISGKILSTGRFVGQPTNVPKTWKTAPSMATGRLRAAGAGSPTASFVAGGAIGVAVPYTTEKFNGTAWSASGDLVTNTRSAICCGTSSNGLIAGGVNSVFISDTQTYNGTSWSLTTSMPAARSSAAGMGTPSAALATGGSSVLTTTVSFNGTSWASGGAMSVGRQQHSGAGTSTNAFVVGGQNTTDPTYTTSTEKYNGTSWSSSGASPVARYDFACSGTTASGLAFGGLISGVEDNTTSFYDGTVWAVSDTMLTGRSAHVGYGPSGVSAFAATGNVSGSRSATTTVYS